MEIEQLERLASIIGEPSRARMLWSLLDGKAYTATELAIFANASRQSTSMHLAKMVDFGLLKVSSQGRHRYYSYARNEVAYAIEGMAALIPPLEVNPIPKNDQLVPIKYCRTCYDHMAGQIGVAFADRLLLLQYLTLEDNVFSVTQTGRDFFGDFGIDIPGLSKQKRPITKTCMDWSERRFHVAGSLGKALLDGMLQNDWVRRTSNSRALLITSKGKEQLYKIFGLSTI